MGFYDAIDLDWTWDGDYIVGADGDLQDTSDDQIRSLENELRTLIKSESGDWLKHPSFATDLYKYIGEPNNRDTADKITGRIRYSIIQAGLLNSGDLDIKIAPVGIHEVLVVISVIAVVTPNNRLEFGEPVVISLLYNTMESGLFFLPVNQTERQGKGY